MTNRQINIVAVSAVVLIIVLLLTSVNQCKRKEEALRSLQSQQALYDTITLVDTIWEKEVITVPAKDALKLDVRDAETKKWLSEISAQKKIVQAMQLRLQSADSTIIALRKDSTYNSEADSWSDYYSFSDTMGNLEVAGTVNFSDTDALKLKYLYNLVVRSSIKEEKDKFVASYSVNDTNVKLIGADNLIIPKKPTQKKKVASIVTPIATYVLGVLSGFFITQKH